MSDRDFEHKKIEIEYQKLQLDKLKAKNDSRFFNKHFGVIVTGIISFFAVLISYYQVRLAQEDVQVKRLQSIESQQRYNKMLEDENREKENAKRQKEKILRLELTQFIITNYEAIASKDQIKRDLILELMVTQFPSDLVNNFVKNLKENSRNLKLSTSQTTFKKFDIAQDIEEESSRTWYRDEDGDGYGNSGDYTKSDTQPDGYVQNNLDPYDQNEKAFPGQTAFFTINRGDGSFDYNGDGLEEKQFTTIGQCIESCGSSSQGWSSFIPNPGQQGQWLADCDFKPLRGGCNREFEARTQGGR